MSYQTQQHAYPTKRRLKGPLHPPGRAPPTSYVTPSNPSPVDASMPDLDAAIIAPRRPSSIQDSPTKKRTLSSSGYVQHQPYPSYYPAAQTQQLQSRGEFVGDASSYPHNGPGSATTQSGSPALASAQRLHAQQQQMMREEEENAAQPPPAKRRRGVAGAIVEGALNTALAAGAAAITAYSLWSTWGQRPAEPGSEPVQAPEKQVEEPPPPPYYEQEAGPSTPLSPSGSQTSTAKTHVYLSSRRRRRPAFQSTKSARQLAMARNAALAHQQTAKPAATAVHDVPDVPGEQEVEQDNDDDDDMDEDDTFRRFQERMSSLIAEGQAALTSQPNLEGLEDESFATNSARWRPASSCNTSQALSPSNERSHIPEPTKNFSTPLRPRLGSHPSGGTPFDFNFTALPRTSPPGAGVGLTAASPWRRDSPSPLSVAQRSGIPVPTSLLQGQSQNASSPASSASPFVFGAPTPPLHSVGRGGPYERRKGSKTSHHLEAAAQRAAGGQPRWH